MPILNKLRRLLGHTQNQQNQLAQFYQNGQLPWTAGYVRHKWQSIIAALQSEELMQCFATGAPLPEGYGWRLDERIIEYPWLLSQLSSKRYRMLDAGSALNHLPLIEALKGLSRDLTIFTLMPESQAFWQQRVSYHFGDLRKTPFANHWFDEVVSISTLEHVGFDNQLYGAEEEEASGDYCVAAIELWRILKPGGVFYITVPYGIAQDLQINGETFARQFDAAMLQKLLDVFSGAEVETRFYRYTAQGWNISKQDDCDNLRYFNIHEQKNYDTDYAAAARAVCCIKVEKPEVRPS